jgi:hypothetical protein
MILQRRLIHYLCNPVNGNCVDIGLDYTSTWYRNFASEVSLEGANRLIPAC